jgi:DeoR/GlpR family transcriptional regulator of sugar metabolism
MRRRRLAQMIRSAGEIRLETAARVLGVSEMTARRDLDVLELMGRTLTEAVPPAVS